MIIFSGQNCEFMKNFTDTSLHVYFAGNLRILGCDGCCSRWYFTFNGAECSSPGPIEGAFYMRTGKNHDLHRHRHIEGHCNNIHKERCEWVSGLEAATLAIRMLTRTQAGPQCLGSSSKRCQRLSSKHVTRDKLDFLDKLKKTIFGTWNYSWSYVEMQCL